MKLTLCFAIALSLSFTSCSTFDPEYAEYKKQKEAQTAGGAQSAFGDPYGVPGGESGVYTPDPPYQPLPGVNNPPPPPDPIPPLGVTPGPTSFPPSLRPLRPWGWRQRSRGQDRAAHRDQG